MFVFVSCKKNVTLKNLFYEEMGEQWNCGKIVRVEPRPPIPPETSIASSETVTDAEKKSL